MRRILAFGFLAVSASACAIAASPASAQTGLAKDSVPIHGQLQLPVQGMVDELTPFDISLNGKTYNTGPITLRLDPSSGTAATLTLDFDTMQATLVTNLLVKAPLLKKLKAPTTTVSVTETGKFKFTELAHHNDKIEIAIAIGNTKSSGSVSGGPFAGALFSNKKRRCTTCCPKWHDPPRSHALVVVDSNGNILSGKAEASEDFPFCASDDGVMTFADQHIAFSGARNGNLAGK
jgi:hypothetical protein